MAAILPLVVIPAEAGIQFVGLGAAEQQSNQLPGFPLWGRCPLEPAPDSNQGRE